MEILKAIQHLPRFIMWVKHGRPEPEIPLSSNRLAMQGVESPNIKDLAAVQDVKMLFLTF